MKTQRSKEEIANWCTALIAETLELPPQEIDPSMEFQSFGFDSTALVSFAVELEEWLGVGVEPSVLFDYPTIATLSAHLAKVPA